MVGEEGYNLLLGDSVLSASLPYVGKVDTMTLADGKLYTVFVVSQREQPLLKPARLEVKGSFDERAVVCRITDKRTLVAMTTQQCENGIIAMPYFLGCYTVVSDTVSPEVKYLGMSGRKLKFIIRDELTGIAAYRGEVNGKWGLFEYDAKNDQLTCRVDEPVFVRGRNEVRVMVCDKAGNVTEKQIVFQLGK